jgi:ribonuclease HII
MDPEPGSKARPTLEYERAARRGGHAVVAGVDEVGRGSWAGPVVAAAVILPLRRRGLARTLEIVHDSKQLTAEQRILAYESIFAVGALVSLGWASHHVIDRCGLAFANRRAMCRAIAGLPITPNLVLIDHFALPECDLPQVCITRGDAECLSIAAASVVAKVFRDNCMSRLDRRYPGYGFSRHKGYGTADHRAALATLGISPLHRRSFGPIAALAS